MCRIIIYTLFSFSEQPQYAAIKHSFDIWYGTKNIGKKILKVLMTANLFI